MLSNKSPGKVPLFQNKFSIAVATVFLSMSQYTFDSNPTTIDGEYILNSDCICKKGLIHASNFVTLNYSLKNHNFICE